MRLKDMIFNLDSPDAQRSFLVDTIKGVQEQRISAEDALDVIDSYLKIKQGQSDYKILKHYYPRRHSKRRG